MMRLERPDLGRVKLPPMKASEEGSPSTVSSPYSSGGTSITLFFRDATEAAAAADEASVGLMGGLKLLGGEVGYQTTGQFKTFYKLTRYSFPFLPL